MFSSALKESGEENGPPSKKLKTSEENEVDVENKSCGDKTNGSHDMINETSENTNGSCDDVKPPTVTIGVRYIYTSTHSTHGTTHTHTPHSLHCVVVIVGSS